MHGLRDKAAIITEAASMVHASNPTTSSCSERSTSMVTPSVPVRHILLSRAFAPALRHDGERSLYSTVLRPGRTTMKIRYTVALSMLAGVMVGGAAIQALHAQAT